MERRPHRRTQAEPRHIWAIRQQLKNANRIRDLALFNCAIDAKLRGCDLVKLRVSDLAPGGVLRQRATSCSRRRVDRSCSKSPSRRARRSRLGWFAAAPRQPGEHLSIRQYARLVGEWVALIDLEPTAYGTHSLRRTKVALVYKRTGNLRACQLLLGHRKLESTVRYLGIEVDDALALSEQTEI